MPIYIVIVVSQRRLNALGSRLRLLFSANSSRSINELEYVPVQMNSACINHTMQISTRAFTGRRNKICC